MKISSRMSKKLQFFSFVFSVGMVIYHSLGAIGAQKIVCNSKVEELTTLMVNNIRGLLGGVSMHYFFFMSAFLLYCNIDSSNWKRKISSRVISLGVPYIVWNLPFVMISSVRRRAVLDMRFVIRRVVLDPYIGPSWYLLALLLLLFCTPIFVWIYKMKKGIWIHTSLCILIILTNRYFLNLDSYVLSTDFTVWIPRLIIYLPTYFIGMYCGLYYAEYYTVLEKNKLVLIVMLGTSVFSFANGNGSNVISILFIITCWYLSDCFIEQINTEKLIYKCAFLIYMGHDLILRVLSGFYSSLQQIRGYFLLPLFVLSALVTVGSMYVFAVVLNKCCPKLLKVITGDRFYR